MKNYIGSITGGSSFATIFGTSTNFAFFVDPTKLFETIILAAVGAAVGYGVQQLLIKIFKKKKKSENK